MLYINRELNFFNIKLVEKVKFETLTLCGFFF